jgi:hypothetical protein
VWGVVCGVTRNVSTMYDLCTPYQPLLTHFGRPIDSVFEPAALSCSAPYSPDVAPCDYALFGPMKRPLKGKYFETDDDVKSAVKQILKDIDEDSYRKWIRALPNRYEKIIIANGDYAL